MKILSVDTTSASCSVGILDEGLLKAEATTEKKQTHSRHLLQMIDMVVRMAGTPLHDMDAFAVVVGPGSFTGIRIGVSAVQGFALALFKPVVGVSSLETLASQAAPAPCLICPLLDARRGEVYTALFRSKKESLQPVIEEHVTAPQSILHSIDAPCLFIGNGAQVYGKLIQKKLGSNAVFTASGLNKIRAESVGRLAVRKLQTQGADRLKRFAMIPRYIRKSDAEIVADKNKVTRE